MIAACHESLVLEFHVVHIPQGQTVYCTVWEAAYRILNSYLVLVPVSARSFHMYLQQASQNMLQHFSFIAYEHQLDQ